MRRIPTIESNDILLWLLVVSVAAAVYLYRIDVLLTLGLVMLASVFLGLLTFSLTGSDGGEEEDQAESAAEDAASIAAGDPDVQPLAEGE